MPEPSLLGRTVLLVTLAAVASARCGKSPTQPTPPTTTPAAPSIACPASTTAASIAGAAALVAYGDPVVSGGQSPLTTTCTPVSGASFPLGTTGVTCKTTDALARTASCAFSVQVSVPATIALTSFAAFGDSITYGENGALAPTISSYGLGAKLFGTIAKPLAQVGSPYPALLESYLRLRYTAQTPSVANFGKIGEDAGDPTAVTRFSTTVLAGSFQAVLIMEGANDLDEDDPTGTINSAIGGLTNLIAKAKGGGLKTFLATIPPEDPTGYNARPSAVVLAFNDRVRTLAASSGVALVDVYPSLPPTGLIAAGLLGADGLHPTQAGYVLVANQFFQVLETTLEVPAKAPAALPAALRRP